MATFIICDSCNKAIDAEQINTILADNRVKRDDQYYCDSCFPSIDFDRVEQKHVELAKKKHKSYNQPNQKSAPVSGWFVEKGGRKNK